MTDPVVDPKTQWQASQTDTNTEWEVVFGGSEDFFDDPNFLSKIWQWNTTTNIEEDISTENIENIFEEEKKPEQIEIAQPNITEQLDVSNLDVWLNDEKPSVIVQDSTDNNQLEVDDMKEIITEKPVENIEVNPEDNIVEDEIETALPEEIIETTKPEVEDIVASNPEQDEVEIAEDDKEEEDKVEEDKVEDENLSEFGKKFVNLKNILTEVYEARKTLWYENMDFETIWANSDRSKIVYHFAIEEDEKLSIEKLETNKENWEETNHKMVLELGESNLIIGMDDVIIFEEEKDLEKDPKKKIQVMEKINKFIFLAGEYQNSIQMEMREKMEEEKEKKKMQDIFRNF